ncbi:hypothetical protein MANES_02G198001v8 [Manihot esculenta]|uniref:Uncharacterized protein n=4 Tax=Manihot esculenta TaxID=3983 RepID=A0ACB7I7G6_MANES|nr:hypothetical protein MANES_02G198001v8 [Manihot esculenta]KAG8660818.1 hypothetical protein MANES_02G198001v8 [Manihot esculenta]
MEDTVDGSVDFKGRPVLRSSSGRWRSASFIIAVEMAERFAYYGISSNLITYLTGSLGQSTATAAENVNTWSGTATLLPLLGAFVADSFLGRYRTIIAASLIYVLGLGLLTISAALISIDISDFENTKNGTLYSPPWFQVILFYFSLYLVAVGQGGHKPCVQAFGADQFDGQDPKESIEKSSFFNWWTCCLSLGILISLVVVIYIQENINWVLGFGIPCIVMLAALVVFLLGSKTYRYSIKGSEINPFIRIGRVIFREVRYWRSNATGMARKDEVYSCDQSSEQFKLLNKALLEPNGLMDDEEVCNVRDVEEAKGLVRLIPIWATSLSYAIVYAQGSTLFTKQGVTMDRTIFPGFQIPSASLQIVIPFAIVLFTPIYDRIFVPLARSLTGNSSGISKLQRIGIGMFVSALSMVVAATVEKKRLETAREYGMVDLPNATIPMRFWWLVPQYLLFGVADVFILIGLQEFFYDQVPKDLRSMGLSLYLSGIGVGSFLSSFLVSVIDKATDGDGKESWFCNNLNRAHLDYFYWLLAAISTAGFILYLNFARSYIYR